jgi:electron transfer flavoprotein beta subunit
LKIAVAIKQVPDTETKVVMGADGRSLDDSNTTFVVNPFDEYALEEALRIKESKGEGEVVVVSVGPSRASQALRTCLAVGADRAIHVKEEGADRLDSLVVARALAAVMRGIGPDLVLTGKYAVGSDEQAAGAMLAELMGMPHVSVVTKLTLEEGKAVAERESDGAVEVMQATLPCLITAQKGLNEPRYASLKGIMAAKRKPLEEVTLASLGLEGTAAAPKITWEKLEPSPEKSAGTVIKEEDPAAAARELVRLLHEEAKII